MAFEDSLRQRARIETKTTLTQDAYGNKAESWVLIMDDVPCRVSLPSSARRPHQVDGAQAVSLLCTVYMGYRTDVKAHCRLLIDGEAFRVVFVNDPAGRHHHLCLTCELVRS